MNWTDLFNDELIKKFGQNPDADKFQQTFLWVDELYEKALNVLNPDKLASMPPQDVYAELKELSIPQCPFRVAHFGRATDSESIVESLIKLLTVQGGLEEKYRAAKFPQAGVVTITEILCIARPTRFICRNAAFTKALAKIVPLYSKKALDELPYREYLDICREMIRVVEEYIPEKKEWIDSRRYLLLYAILTSK